MKAGRGEGGEVVGRESTDSAERGGNREGNVWKGSAEDEAEE